MPNGTPTPHFGAVTAARASTFDWFWSSRIWLLYRNRVKPGRTRPTTRSLLEHAWADCP
ncbi:hypothetical protein EMIT0P176_160072 [Pseudomonas sp. IT-P176]